MTDYDRALKILGPDNMMKLNLSGLTVISRNALNRLKFEHEEMRIELEEKGDTNVQIKIVLEPGAKLPHRSTDGAAGWDLFACIDKPMRIYPGCSYTVPTGVRVQLPEGHYWKIESRSGLSKNYAINAEAGVIDQDFRGIVNVILSNSGHEVYRIMPGEKIGQAILLKYEEQEFELVDQLDSTERGEKGFGHTGRT